MKHASIEEALEHFNRSYRQRWRLREVSPAELGLVDGRPATLELHGADDERDMDDAQCASIARAVRALTSPVSFTLIGGELALAFDPGGEWDTTAVDAQLRRARNAARDNMRSLVATAAADEDPRSEGDGLQPPDAYLSKRRLSEAAFVTGYSEDVIRDWFDRLYANQKRPHRGKPRAK